MCSNLILIFNHFFDVAPNTKGYKAAHCALFMAIMDSINRNRWNKTRIDYERIINKCCFNKRTYLECRQWLMDNKFIEVEIGKNGYQMAVFSIGSAVQNYTATGTATGTATAPLLVPNSKHINNKTIKHLNIPFDEFWNLYDKKVGDKSKLEKKWAVLSDEERTAVINYLPGYIKATPDKKFRKDPQTFFNNKSWNDEVIKPIKNPDKTSTEIEFMKSIGL